MIRRVLRQCFNSGTSRLAALLLLCVGSIGVSTVHAQTAGLLSGGAKKLAPLTLSSGQPVASGPYELESGGYYKIEIIGDGSAELALHGAGFFRNIWVDEVVINDLEVRPLGLDSIEFDDEGVVEIKFVAIKPGTYIVRIPGTTGETQQAVFTIR